MTIPTLVTLTQLLAHLRLPAPGSPANRTSDPAG